jgi:hypothetical protein
MQAPGRALFQSTQYTLDNFSGDPEIVVEVTSDVD